MYKREDKQSTSTLGYEIFLNEILKEVNILNIYKFKNRLNNFQCTGGCKIICKYNLDSTKKNMELEKTWRKNKTDGKSASKYINIGTSHNERNDLIKVKPSSHITQCSSKFLY